MRSKGQTYLLKELSETRISNGAFNDPKKVGRGYRLINVSDLYVEPKINVNKLTRLEVTPKELHNFTAKRGDIFFTRSSLKLEGIAHCNIFDSDTEDVIYECHVMRVRPKQHLVLPMYLKEYCRSDMARKYFMRNAKTTTMTTIDQDGVGALPVVVPPLNIQKTVVELMTTWNSAIEKTERLIEAKESRFSWLIKSLIGDQCRHWEHHQAEKIFKSISEKNNTDEELLSVTQDQGVIPRTMLEGRVMSPEGSTDTYKMIKKGDFAISLRSFQGGIEYSRYQGLISPAYTVLRPRLKIDDEFYRHFFKSYLFIGKYLNIAVIGIRDGKQISIPDFMTVKIPYPSLEQQQQIAETLNTARQEIDLLKKQVEAYRKQKRGLMQKLLTGQWRVSSE
jgi:type I restriction enzyme S subunit